MASKDEARDQELAQLQTEWMEVRRQGATAPIGSDLDRHLIEVQKSIKARAAELGGNVHDE